MSINVTVDEIREVLSNVKATQDSVPHVSKWITQRKQEIDNITRVWFDLYKTGSDDLQTALFFLMNDCVQKAKHDRDQHIPITFHPHIVNAITFSGEAVKKPIRRCLDVLAERSVYPAHVIAEMKAALDGSLDLGTTSDGDDGLNLDIDQFRKRLDHYSEACNSLDKARKILDSMIFDIDANDERTRSKSGVMELESEVDLMLEKFQKFIASIEAQYNRTLKIKQLNGKALKFYANQDKDVTVVHDAYDRFAKGIDSSRTLLEQILQTGVLPGRTPPDAPSPTPSEEGVTATDDVEDMQMDEDDKPLSENPEAALIPQEDYIPFPVSSQPPNIHQPPPSSSSNNNNNLVSAAKADPRKGRFTGPVNPTIAAFQQLPHLPEGLTNMLPNHPLPGHFYTAPPPGLPHQAVSFPGAPSLIGQNPNFVGNQRASVESQDSNRAGSVNSDYSLERSSSWKTPNNGNGNGPPNFTVQTPTIAMESLGFTSPPPSAPYNHQSPELPSPSQQSNAFFIPGGQRPRFVVPRGARFFTPRGGPPGLQSQRMPPQQGGTPTHRPSSNFNQDSRPIQRGGHFQQDGQSNRRRSTEEFSRGGNDWQGPKRGRR